MTLSPSEIEEKTNQGWVHALITFEIVGRPQEHVEETLQKYVKQLEDSENVIILGEDTAETRELEEENEGFFATFSEVEMLIVSMQGITEICMNMMPASVEILAPSKISFSALDIQNWYNDLLSQLHHISQTLSGERQKNSFQTKNITNLLQNMMMILLAQEPRTVEDLIKFTGVEEQHVEKMLKHMQEQTLVEEKDGTWTLNSSEK